MERVKSALTEFARYQARNPRLGASWRTACWSIVRGELEGRPPDDGKRPFAYSRKEIKSGMKFLVRLTGVAVLSTALAASLIGPARAAAPILIKSCQILKPKPLSH